MLRLSMSRKVAHLTHLPKSLVEQLTDDLLPLPASGFCPLRVEVVATVTGTVGAAQALIPIKNLNDLIRRALGECDELQSTVEEFAEQLWRRLDERIAAEKPLLARNGYAPDLTLDKLQLIFENAVTYTLENKNAEWSAAYPLSFQHVVDFDRDAEGNLLFHGHDARVEVVMPAEPGFLTHVKPRLASLISATGEKLVREIAQALVENGFEKARRVTMLETNKNSFSGEFGKLPS